jgi:hypothetical protein
MIRFFEEMGVSAYPLLLLTLCMFGQVIWALRGLPRPGDPAPGCGFRIHAVLAWGGLTALMGLLGSLVGVGVMAQAVALAGDASRPLIWGGLRLALSTTVFGFLVLFLAGLAWMGLLVLEGRRSEATAGRGNHGYA